MNELNFFTVTRCVLRSALTCALAVNASQSFAAESNSALILNDANKNTSPLRAESGCRSGAFLDAIKLMNAASRSLESLERSDAAVAKAELSAILTVSIKQASEEYHCVKGTLVLGYDVSYAATVKRAAAHARAAKLSPETLRVATDLIAAIEASGKPHTAQK